MKNLNNKIWFILPFIISLLVFIPIAIIIYSFFLKTSGYATLLSKTYLLNYLIQTLILLISVIFLTSVLGIGSAYFITFYKFPGCNFFSWSLILPFAIPGYIYAYSLNAFFSNYGVGYTLLNFIYSGVNYNEIIPKINGINGAIISLSFSLFVYVYLIVRISFSYQSQNMIDAAKNLGFGPIRIFTKILLPAARPGIIVGLSLVGMEVLSDFGTVSFFSVNTLTLAIYDSWLIFDDLTTANQFSFYLILFIFVFFFIENYSRSRSKFHTPLKGFKNIEKITLKGNKARFVTLFFFLIFFCSFIFPIMQMIYWIIKFPKFYGVFEFMGIFLNTLYLILISTVILIVFSLIINYGIRLNQNSLLSYLTNICTSGYAIPGVIMSVTLLTFFSYFSELIEKLFYLNNVKNFFIGTTFTLFVAYFIRFFSLAVNGIKSGYEKLNISMDSASAMLGFSKFKTFKKIHLSFLKKNLILISLLIAIDIIKELPMTLILRPYNFETFATKAYYYASQDLVELAGTPSLLLVLITSFLILMLKRFTLKDF